MVVVEEFGDGVDVRAQARTLGFSRSGREKKV